MRIVHDSYACEAHGICAAIDPDRFELGADDLLTIHEWWVDPPDLDLVRQAVASCPKQALSLTDESEK